ncbi:MAG: redox-regulated ATPase YchF [Clostridia bacterium]|nr:MAG: redox-regulated ATPase YchF [Clostridia bacterium]
MALSCGLIGLPTVGKTTFYNLLTGAGADTSRFVSGRKDTHRGTATVPDVRVDFLASRYKPRKTTYAQIEVVDVPGLTRGAGQGGEAFLAGVREVDALVYILRAFSNPEVLHVEGSVDPWRDLRAVNLELVLADLDLAEKRRERISQAKKIKPEQEKELEILERCIATLEAEKFLSRQEFSPEEEIIVTNLGFLTRKPVILVVNVDETQLTSGQFPEADRLLAYATEQERPLLAISARAEAEISQLAPEDQPAFLEDLGIAEPGLVRLARAMYQVLGLVSFFTVGEDEVKAWTIRQDTPARKAAGKVHSDIERGFIRAEVVGYDDLAACGSMARAREKGLVRLEGKDYLIRDGDIVHFRFNV